MKFSHFKKNHMKTLTLNIKGFLIALLLTGLSFSGYSTKWVVSVENFQFNPSSLPSVNPGDTIRWEWVSGIHTTTSTAIPAGAVPWDNPIDATNTFFEYVTTVSGTYNYHCMHHPTTMIASFNVSGFIPNLNVSPSNQNVLFTAGSTSFSVTSNWNWNASSNSTWCTVTPSGTGNGTLTANYLANSGDTRVATITVTVTGLTPQMVTVTQDGTTGIVVNTVAKLYIYPNPTNGIISIVSNSSGSKQSDLTVMDINGKTIFENMVNPGQQVNMDLSTYPGGYYFVRMITDNGTLTRKVILNK